MMQSNDEELLSPDENSRLSVPSNSAGNIGLSLSAVGLLGWTVTLVLILIMAAKKDPTVPLSEPFFYLVQVVVGFAGMLVCGTLSAIGLIVSVTGLRHPNRDNAVNGMIGGILGLLIAVGIIFWRVLAWREVL